jgi:uncharacterized membrane protein
VTWWTVLALAGGTYLLKAAGPLLVGGRRLPPRVALVAALLPAALLSALVAVQTVSGEGRALVLDARLLAVAVAAFAVWRKAPFLVVILIGTATAALARLAGLP